MKPVSIIEEIAAIHAEDNIDTDQICPARFLHTPRAEGYGDALFRDARFTAEGTATAFVLNQPPFTAARILVGGDNFGCGSSREQAVWALADFGIEAVIATAFGDIFRGNCVKNGILPVTLDPASLGAVKAALAVAPRARIELAPQTLRIGEMAWPFTLDIFSKDRLLTGLSEIAETLKGEMALAGFERAYGVRYPWMFC